MATNGNYTWTPSTYPPGVGYPNRAKISWSATWNQASMLWTVNWNATAQGASNAGRYTTVYGTPSNVSSYVTVYDENGNVLQTKTIASTMTYVKNDTVLLEGTFTIGVNTNGDRSLRFAGQIYFETTGSAGISSGDQTFALDNIPLASSISSISPNNVAVDADGTSVTVNISRNNNAYTHTVAWSFGGHSTTQTGQGTSATTTIPASWLDAIPTATSGTATVTVTTYNGAVQIGAPKSANFTITAAVTPSITSVTASPRGAAYNAGMTSVYIAGYSTAYISASGAAAGAGASLAKYEFIRDGQVLASYNSSAASYNYTTGVLSGSSATFSVRVTDSRGMQATKDASAVAIAAYALPAFSNTQIYRSDSGGDPDNSGEYAYIKTTVTATPAQNSITGLTYARKKTTDANYGAETSLTNGTALIVSGIDNVYSYEIRITATDRLGNKAYYYATIQTESFTMDFKVGGDGVAFGKVAETSNLLDSAWPIRSTGNIYAGTGEASEHQIGVNSLAGPLYLYSHGTANGYRGIWLPAHGTGAAKNVLTIDTNNNVTIAADNYGFKTVSLTAGQTATITFNADEFAALICGTGWIYSGYGHLAFLSGYVSGSRLSKTDIKADSNLVYGLTNSANSFTIRNNNSGTVTLTFLVLRGAINSIA